MTKLIKRTLCRKANNINFNTNGDGNLTTVQNIVRETKNVLSPAVYSNKKTLDNLLVNDLDIHEIPFIFFPFQPLFIK